MSLTPIVNHAQYYVVRDQRLYHASPGPYPLPVDTPEQERLEIQHNMLKGILQSNYFGPVEEVLQATVDKQRVVLDLGTGKGHWAIDMALEFPHAVVVGLDHVPIMETVDLPDNVNFVVEDINEQIRDPAGAADLCHARDISLAVVNYGALVDEVHRLLRPGGLFLSGEWDLGSIVQTEHLQVFMERTRRAFQDLRHLHQVPVNVFGLLSHDTRFVDVHLDLRTLPLGHDVHHQDLGVLCREIFSRFMDSVRPLLDETSMSGLELDSLYRNVRQELTTTLVPLTYRMVWATKA